MAKASFSVVTLKPAVNFPRPHHCGGEGRNRVGLFFTEGSVDPMMLCKSHQKSIEGQSLHTAQNFLHNSRWGTARQMRGRQEEIVLHQVQQFQLMDGGIDQVSLCNMKLSFISTQEEIISP